MDPDPARAPGRERWARRAAWALVALVLALSLPGSVHPWYDPTNDGSMYIATARSLASGEGYSYLGEPFRIRPPGFPCLIAPLIALRGTDFHALNLTVALWGALGVLAFHFLLRERLGLVLSVLVPLVLWFNPGYQRLCNQVMSDVPGWTLLVACLWLAARGWASASAGRAFLLGAALGLASYVRSGNLLLVPALLAAELLRPRTAGAEARSRTERARRVGALVLGAVLVLLPWSLRNRAVAPPPPADQTLLYDYSTAMWHADMGDPRSPRLAPGELAARFDQQFGKSVTTLGTRLTEDGAGRWTPVLAAVLIAALVLAAWRRRACEELFALGTLLVVAFYFGYAGRLLLPVFALALVALVELVRDGIARLAGARAGVASAALLCVVWLVLDWRPRAHWAEIEALHQAYASLAGQVRARLPEEARLGAYRGWHHSVYLERPVYSFEHACERAGNPAASEDIIAKYSLDTALLTPLGLPASVQPAERACAAFLARRHGGNELGLLRLR
jgi:4-amino-4-deoxy-L-arabinose transferase-like glycosyltransferase